MLSSYYVSSGCILNCIILLNVDIFSFTIRSANVFGVSTESMQLSFDARGNSVPTILLLMQRHLYAQGGLQVFILAPMSFRALLVTI